MKCYMVLLLVIIGFTSGQLLKPTSVSELTPYIYAGVFLAVGFAIGKRAQGKRS
jgi:hypothetical protein